MVVILPGHRSVRSLYCVYEKRQLKGKLRNARQIEKVVRSRIEEKRWIYAISGSTDYLVSGTNSRFTPLKTFPLIVGWKGKKLG